VGLAAGAVVQVEERRGLLGLAGIDGDGFGQGSRCGRHRYPHAVLMEWHWSPLEVVPPLEVIWVASA
jgi:hypothetical protein